MGVGLQRSGQHAQIGDIAQTGQIDLTLDDTDVQPLPYRGDVGGRADDVHPGPAEVGAANHAGGVAVQPAEVLPLNAELRRLVGSYFGNQRFHIHLRPARIQPVDHGAQIVVLVIRCGDDQGIGRHIRLHDARPLHRCRASRRHATGPTHAAAKTATARAPAQTAAFAIQNGPQRLCQFRRIGIAQVHHMNVARAAGRRVQPHRQATRPRHQRRIVAADQHGIGARIRHHLHPPPRLGRRPDIGPIAQQTVEHLRHVQRRGVFQLHTDKLAIAGLVNGVDDFVDAADVVGVIGNHQGVGIAVGHDAVGRGNQRAQHRQQLAGRLITQRINLSDDLVATGSGGRGSNGGGALLGIGFRQNAHHPVALHGAEALQAQRRQQDLVGQLLGHRTGGHDVDIALDAGIENEILAADHAHGLHHRLDVGIDKIQGDLIVLPRRDRRHPQQQGTQQPAQHFDSQHNHFIRDRHKGAILPVTRCDMGKTT